MTHLIPTVQMEWRRISTLPAIWVLAFVAVALGGFVSAFVAATQPEGALSATSTRTVLTGGSSGSLVSFVGLPLLFAGVMAVVEDTRFKLATVLLVAQPRRTTLMTARLLVLAGITAAVCVVQMAVTSIVALALDRTPRFGELPGIFAVHLFVLLLFVWAGTALSWLTGTAVAPVALVLAEVLLLEPMAAVAGEAYSRNEYDKYATYLPFTTARDTLALDASALIRIVLYASVLLACAWLSVRNRDY